MMRRDCVCNGSFVVLPEGYYMGTVEAVQAMLEVQQEAVRTRMQPKQYGGPLTDFTLYCDSCCLRQEHFACPAVAAVARRVGLSMCT